ncbi:PREDICTED: EPIDERMAL PATTERNING FACTOR-like protein 2-like [Fragaria vesca subsp. vesca]
MAEGRALLKKDDTSQIVNEDNKARVRAQIGSRPPKCEGMCSSCGPCEAIQVPNNFQAKPGKRNSSTVVSTIAYARGNEYSSNYKPMSWKCKCGTIIFNP